MGLHESRSFHWLAIVSLLAFTALWLTRWPLFPVGIDPAYHLCIARQMVEAGGVLTYEWWEAAPFGRPHLYPPLLHVLLAGFLKLGCPPITALRLLSAILIPGVMGSIYMVMRRLVGERVALACLWMAMMPFGWMLQLTEAMASGVALLELLWLVAALAARRGMAAACLLALMGYTHLGLPWIALAGLGWAAALGAFKPHRSLWRIMVAGLVLAGPWLWHLLHHVNDLQVVSRMENQSLELLPALYGIAVVGAWACWRPLDEGPGIAGGAPRAGSPRILLGLWLGSCLIAYPFTFRWLSGEGLLPTILLAGYGLGTLAHHLSQRWRWGGLEELGLVMFLSGAVLLSPSVVVDAGRWHWRWPDTAPFHLLNWPALQPSVEETQLVNRYTEPLSRTVAAGTPPGAIVWSNAPYAGGLVAALAARATSSFMFEEVPPSRPVDPFAVAQRLVWFKILPLPGTPALETIIRRYDLQLVADTDLAMVFQNPHARELARHPRAIISWPPVFVLSCLLLGVVLWDFHRRSIEERAGWLH